MGHDGQRMYRISVQMEGVERAVVYEVGMADAMILQVGYEPLVQKLQGLIPEAVGALLLASDLREDLDDDE